MESTPLDRHRLRAALRAAYPWLASTQVGPAAVEAGECDRCGHRPRYVPTCGPVTWTALCGPCALDVGDDAWCEGHHDEGLAAQAWAAALPAEGATLIRLWWVATGEVAVDAHWLRVARDEAAPPVRSVMPTISE